MSTLRVDNITNEAGSASPNLPNGLSGDVLTSGTVDTARMPAGSVIQVISASNEDKIFRNVNPNEAWINILFNDVELVAKSDNPTILLSSIVHVGQPGSSNNPYAVFRWEFKVGTSGSYSHLFPYTVPESPPVVSDFFFGGGPDVDDNSNRYRLMHLPCQKAGSISCQSGESIFFRLMYSGKDDATFYLNQSDESDQSSYEYYGGAQQSRLQIMEVNS